MKKEILLAHYPKINYQRYQNLLAAFSDLKNAWQANSSDYKKTGWPADAINDFLGWKNKVDEEKISQILNAEEIYCLTIDDPLYPPLLKTIYDPPFCLFVRGNLKNLEFPLAVVGPRKYSPYGKQVAENIVAGLSGFGFNIVSGLALGIDGIAHQTALEMRGSTLAVLGGGINKNSIYPSCHRDLSERIIRSGGALIGEYPPGAFPSKYSFPQRNRIVAGMCLGTLVIEGAENSGALITAQCALDSGREVFAVPQNITSPNAGGVNQLIKNGAHPITDAQDIVDILNLQEKIKIMPGNYADDNGTDSRSPIENKILSILSQEPMHIDVIGKLLKWSGNEVSSTLAMLEIEGKIKNTGSMMFIKK